MKTPTKAQVDQTAQYIAEFIIYNKIDVTVVPMGTIVKGYFDAQEEVCNDAGIKALGFFCGQEQRT